MTEEKLELYAFWSYDLYPFVLGGQFTKMDDKGSVYVPAYQGWIKKPIKILPLEAGQDLLNKLMELREEHRTATDLLDRDFNAKAIKLLPEIAKGFYQIRLPKDSTGEIEKENVNL